MSLGYVRFSETVSSGSWRRMATAAEIGAVVDGATLHPGHGTLSTPVARAATAEHARVLDEKKAAASVAKAQGAIANGNSPVVVSSGAKLVVSSGMHLASVIVQAYGEIELAGGRVDHLTLAIGAAESVASGVTISNFNAVITTLIVSSGGTAINTTLTNGRLIYAGGQAIGVKTNIGGALAVAPGTTVSGLKIEKRLPLTVSSGATANGTIISKGGEVIVSSGATVSGTVVQSGGELILQGGQETGTTILDGGKEVIGNGAILSVTSGMVVSNLTVASGGTLVLAGGQALGTSFEGGSNEVLLSGGSISGTAVTGCNLILSSGGSARDIQLSYANIVYAGGVATGVTLKSFANAEIRSGATTSGLNVLKNGHNKVTVSSGGTLLNAVIDGATLDVQSGGHESGSLLTGATTGTIAEGATGANEIVSRGAHLYDYGAVIGAKVLSGGSATIQGAMSALVVERGGRFDLGAGTVIGAVIEGYGTVNSELIDGQITGIDAKVYVGNFGEASGARIAKRGALIVGDGGYASATTVEAGGLLTISRGADLEDAEVQSGGKLIIQTFGDGNGSITGIRVQGGGTLDDAEGDLSGVSIDAGGYAKVTGAAISQAAVSSGAELELGTGATATAVKVLRGGDVIVANGTLDGITFAAGARADIESKVTASRGIILAIAEVHSRATLTLAGAKVQQLVIEAGGNAVVAGGSVVKGTTLRGVTALTVSSGGKSVGVTVSNGGTETVGFRGTAIETTIRAGGHELVTFGGTASDCSVENGGTLTVADGGTVAKTVVSAGGLLTLSGGDAKNIHIAGKGTVTLAKAGKSESFVLDAGGRLDVVNIDFISGTKLSFVENAAHTQGKLTVTGGGQSQSVTLFGQYAAGGFALKKDGSGGCMVTYNQPAARQHPPEIAPHH